jgi:hypothetical protein
MFMWDSPKTEAEVLATLRCLTEKKTRQFPMSCSVKQQGAGESQFTLWYAPFFDIGKISYHPPVLKGSIRGTESGCTVSAEVRRLGTGIENLGSVGLILLFVFMGVAALIAGFHLAVVPAILSFALAIGCGGWYVHTYRTYGALRVHLDILNTAAGANYREVFS